MNNPVYKSKSLLITGQEGIEVSVGIDPIFLHLRLCMDVGDKSHDPAGFTLTWMDSDIIDMMSKRF
jgi:hypothetical protein